MRLTESGLRISGAGNAYADAVPALMREPTSTPPLARAFLALADDGTAPEQRSPARTCAAAIAALVLALAVPLGWAVDHPVAGVVAKSMQLDDEPGA